MWEHYSEGYDYEFDSYIDYYVMFADMTGDGINEIIWIYKYHQHGQTHVDMPDTEHSSSLVFDRVCSSICDANHDGIADLLCEAVANTPNPPHCVIFGGPDLAADSPCVDDTGLDTTPLPRWPPPTPEVPVNRATLFFPGSTEVRDLGDQTGDGYVDWMATYPNNQRLIYSGAPR